MEPSTVTLEINSQYAHSSPQPGKFTGEAYNDTKFVSISKQIPLPLEMNINPYLDHREQCKSDRYRHRGHSRHSENSTFQFSQ